MERVNPVADKVPAARVVRDPQCRVKAVEVVAAAVRVRVAAVVAAEAMAVAVRNVVRILDTAMTAGSAHGKAGRCVSKRIRKKPEPKRESIP